MSLWKIAWRSIQQRTLVSLLTVVAMGLGVALVVAVLVVYNVVDQSFHRGGEGYDLIVGAKGGREQLVLNTVFYLSRPVGNIPYKLYEEMHEGRLAAYVETAIPVCMGHTYQGLPVVGTVPEIFTDLKYRGDQSYQIAQGENFKKENRFDGVLGSVAATKTRLQVGEPFRIVHGGEGGAVHKESFKVVGILAPTGTPVDNAVFVNMFGFHALHSTEEADHGEHEEHEKHDAHDEHDEHGHEIKEISAILVCVPKKMAEAGGTDVVAKMINTGMVVIDGKPVQAQALVPTQVITELFEGILGKLQWILLGMSVLTVIEAGIGIMVSIYNSMSDRRHEIAIMRALGASRMTVMVIILMESILLSLMGGAMGLLIGHGAIWLCSPWIAEWTGVFVGLLQFQTVELMLIPGLVVLASAVGYLPAMSAYRTDVAKSLITTP
jgi:putative ABC transport system permease protein